jgi:plasmid stability protein
MTTIITLQLDEALINSVQNYASKHNCSIEEEVRRILKQVLLPIEPQKKFGSYLHQHILELSGGIELELPKRSLPRSAPDFFKAQ